MLHLISNTRELPLDHLRELILNRWWETTLNHGFTFAVWGLLLDHTLELMLNHVWEATLNHVIS
ncbi:hypothetical protein PI124_g13916 [Phytophthora idaei]|nr:hypothetical protein PI125_g21859 [Phytophthora idaei]KAG3147095.1 hypothetical protein PI126_g13004 [Phytophthora idaei]KAG3241211.1 hypothetical protein PI124_g13916 [Phytophthora idaei]